jgi:hypothetical protein
LDFRQQQRGAVHGELIVQWVFSSVRVRCAKFY